MIRIKSFLTKSVVLRLIIIAWVMTWAGLLIHGKKDRQYKALAYLYTHAPEERLRYVTGERLSDFIDFCRENLPEDATYRLWCFGNLSLDEVRARYELWPLKRVKDNADFILSFEDKGEVLEGYKEYKRFDGNGLIMIREGAEK